MTARRHAVRSGGAATAFLVAAGWMPAGVAAAGAPVTTDPVTADAATVTQSVALDRSSVALGDEVTIELSGWPIGPAQIELCGNRAARGTSDCDPMSAAAVEVGADGTGRIALLVSRPPSPCPCVIRVSQPSNGATTTVPVEIVGVDVQPDADRTVGGPVRRLELLDVRVDRDESNAAVFGFGAGRRVIVTLRNTGTVALAGVTLSGTLNGRGADGTAVAGPPPFDIPPGAAAQVVVPFELPSPAFGDYRFVGRVDGADDPITFSTATGHTPWGLVNATAVVIAAAVVLGARRRSRRRLLGAAPTTTAHDPARHVATEPTEPAPQDHQPA